MNGRPVPLASLMCLMPHQVAIPSTTSPARQNSVARRFLCRGQLRLQSPSVELRSVPRIPFSEMFSHMHSHRAARRGNCFQLFKREEKLGNAARNEILGHGRHINFRKA